MARSWLRDRLLLGSIMTWLAQMVPAGGGNPFVNVAKQTNGFDNNSAPGLLLPVGSTATFRYVVTSSPVLPIPNVVLVDDNGTPGDPTDDFNPTFVGGDTNGNGVLDISEMWTYTASRIVTAGQFTNVATVSGTGAIGDTDPDNHFGFVEAIHVVKLTNGTDNNLPPGPSIAIGSPVTFTYIVTNPGPAALSNLTVVDDNGTPANPGDDFAAAFQGGDTNGNGLLDVSETWTFAALRIATSGQYTNVATATGVLTLAPFEPVSDTDADYHLGIAPGTPTPTASPTATAMPGGPSPAVPTLSFPMLLLLGVGLAAAGYLVTKRSV